VVQVSVTHKALGRVCIVWVRRRYRRRRRMLYADSRSNSVSISFHRVESGVEGASRLGLGWIAWQSEGSGIRHDVGS